MNLTVNNYLGGTMNGFSTATINTRNTGISKSSSFSTGKSTKKSLNYNAKQISSQLIRATKSRTAAAVLTKAKSTVNNLQHCLGTWEYDDSEVQIALAHAKRMVKCAQSKVSNLKQEENLQRKYERCADMAEYIVSADTVSGCVTGNNCYYQKKGLFQMKNVIFQIKYDFINGIVHQWKKFLLIAVVYAVLITDFLVRCKTKHFMGQYTSSDIILYIFRGMRWIVDVQTDINIPTAYILPNILIGFAIGNYPFKDINGYGGMVLMRAGKKLVWWLSKCIWAVFTACICYGILILEIAGVSLAGGRLSLQVNKQVCISIDGYDKTLIKNNPNLTRLTVYMIIVGLLTTIAICLVQICVSQIMGPIIGYIAVVVILIMGVFFRSFLFIGNGFMALRNIMYTPEGGSLTLTVIADIVLIVVSVIAGYASFRQMDILKKSDWRV